MICIAFSLQFAYFSICLRAILKLQAYRMCCECLQAFLHFHTLSLSISMSSKACCLVNVCRHSFVLKPFPLSISTPFTVHFLANVCSHSFAFAPVPSQSACQCLKSISMSLKVSSLIVQGFHIIVEVLGDSSLRPGFKSSVFLHQLLMSSASFLAPKGSHGFWKNVSSIIVQGF